MHETSISPEPGFRWVVVTAAALLLGIAMGMLVNGLSAFVVPLETHFGWDRADVAAINSFGLLGIALGGIAMGFLADRVATRTICLAGAVVLSLCLILASRAQALWQFHALFFLAGAIGGGALFAPVIALVGGWFRTGAGLAIGIASAGQALGQGLIPFVAGHLIETMGWQAAFTILGAFSALTLVPLSFVMRQPPPAPAPTTVATGGRATISPAILLPALSLAVLGCCTGMSTPLIHLVPLIQGVCGVGAEAGGPLLIMLIAAIGGRLFFGRLSDIIGPVRAWFAATAWQTVLMLGFVTLGSLQAFWIFAPIYGFGYGGVMTGVLTTVRALTPASRRASATGIVLAFGWAGHALGGWQGGVFFDLTETYVVSFAVATAAGAMNLAIVAAIWIALRRRTVAAAA
ncbi:MFS transporter [Silicimonas algicola]|uniref:Putative MFS family arabinose efflux permease n=1 Tax=Silicimonas algicola TaxID=1826607 RepID=A0A316GNU9_9RHOB|nr:MFS transporter [Silicimonas algicola]PWK56607.1 putative MFS family arabinose efflux permease [Silicimonas algicola]